MKGRPCIFGEVLFDHFPDGTRVLGGAPFNVAWHLQAFGQRPRFISRVGRDPEGEAVREAMRTWGMDTKGLQIDPRHPTGWVSVLFDNGDPSYDIVHPCAYDAIEELPQDRVGCGLLYHGTLALRDAISRQSAEALRAGGPEAVFVDVNLRPPWWHRDRVLSMVRRANWVKLNCDELELLSHSERGAEGFLDDHDLQGLVVTRGSDGAELLTADGARHTVRPRDHVDVVDTVGAGDAFASVIILGLAEAWPLDTTLQRAQAFASALVGQRGATVTDANFYRPFVDAWKL